MNKCLQTNIWDTLTLNSYLEVKLNWVPIFGNSETHQRPAGRAFCIMPDIGGNCIVFTNAFIGGGGALGTGLLLWSHLHNC